MLVEIVGANDRVGMALVHLLEPDLVLQDVAHALSILERPFHMGDQTGPGKLSPFWAPEVLLPHGQHSMLIESAVREVRLLPIAQFELAVLLRFVDVDAGRLQSPDVVPAQRGFDHVKGPFAALEAFFDERQQHTIFFFRASEEGADVTLVAELGAGDANGSLLGTHIGLPGERGARTMRRRRVPSIESPHLPVQTGVRKVKNDMLGAARMPTRRSDTS
jgi:hypothetical protein